MLRTGFYIVTGEVVLIHRSTDLNTNEQTQDVLGPDEPNSSPLLIPTKHRLGSGAGVTVPRAPLPSIVQALFRVSTQNIRHWPL